MTSIGTVLPEPEVPCAACGETAAGAIHIALSAVGSGYGRYRECRHCETLTVIDTVDYAALYSTRDSGNYAGARAGLLRSAFVALKKRYLRTQAWKFVKRESRAEKLLDYGCGSGELANALVAAGCTAVVAADVQRERPESLETPIPYVPLSEVYGAGPYETILLRHVLEHVIDPVATLTTLASCLGTHGRIVVEVPSTNSILRRSLGARWPGYYFPFHVCVFSDNGLRMLADRAGLSLVHLERCNPPVLGTVFHDLGVPRSAARVLAILLYPLQFAIGAVSGRPEAVRVTLVPRRTATQ